MKDLSEGKALFEEFFSPGLSTASPVGQVEASTLWEWKWCNVC